MDRDGLLDLVTFTYSTPGQIEWYKQLSDGTFESSKVISSTYDGPYKLKLADFDADGDLYHPVISANNNRVDLLESLNRGRNLCVA